MSAAINAWTENYLDPATVASSSASSAQAAYPASNLYDNKRYKVWRSNGYWNIVGGSNTIVFQETGGVNLTATIAAAAYSSTTAFFAAVKAALEAVGGSIYTVSADTSTGKVKILSDLTGGAGIFSIIWTDSGSTAMAGIVGFSTSLDSTGAASYVADNLCIHTEEFLTWDLGIPSTPRGFAAISVRNNPLKISATATIKLQGNSTNNFTSPQYEATITWADYVLAIEDPNGLPAVPLRYWRLYIQDKANPYGYVELGEIFLGDYVNLARGNAIYPFTSSVQDNATQFVSEGGQTFSSRNSMGQRMQIAWSALTKADLETLEDVFNDYGYHKPFFVSFDQQAAFSTTWQTWVRYCRFDSEMAFQLKSFDNFSASWNLREEL